MWFRSLLASWKSRSSRSRRPQPRPAHRGTRLTLEHLEDRTLPSSYSAASVSALIADINAANKAGAANTISLTAPTTSPYVLTAVNNTTKGATGLPVIAAGDNLTIVGNGDTVERSTASGTPNFRLLAVTGSLTLADLTLQGGVAQCTGYSSSPTPPVGAQVGLKVNLGGGAIYSHGTLVLNGVTVQDNMAMGGPYAPYGGNAAGGGIFSYLGSVSLEGGTIVQDNEALGNSGSLTLGYAYGGGLFACGGTVTVTNATLDNNAAVGGRAGEAFGGGLFAFNYYSQATVTLTNCTVQGNSAGVPVFGGNVTTNLGWPTFSPSSGGGLYVAGGTATLASDTVESNWAKAGGGLYVAGGTVTLVNDTVEANQPSYTYDIFVLNGGTVYIDAFTLANSVIYGTYIET